MTNYQIREKSYTEALASARVGGNLANSLVKTMPNMTSQIATTVDNTNEDITKQETQSFDLAYFQGQASKQKSKNLDYMKKQAIMHYSNKKR